ncbi:MAG: hypothetical protein ACREJ3_09245 [Polyangiaceae bacterium]
MTIIGSRPESGVRIDVQRSRGGGPPWHYCGEAALAEARFEVEATIGADGSVQVRALPGGSRAPDRELIERLRLVLRGAWKHAQKDDTPPPRRIVRWRAD